MTLNRTALKAVLIPVLLAALAGCSTAAEPASSAAQTAPTSTAAPAPAKAAPAPGEASPAPAKAPTLVRTQGAVQIFDGAAPTLLDTTDRYSAKNAIQLTAGPAAGTAVTDAGGFSLYRFDNDTANPSTTTCVDDCAVNWPPLLVDGTAKIYTENVDASLIGYVERSDGTCQVTIGGWPVYYFAGDTAPGQALGQGIGGTWFTIDGTGKKAAQTAAPSEVPGY
jgi:predicted lipoprotein with Yx(FWY)xxD motif